ncbi:MAG: DegT/DnrJ/EryC1/StrS family aminotransferase [Planctomycetota bacterium]|nr:DegT/DnrJ/EryC1/StrS family aminotransferase [Planctomycetota bacterium]MDA1211387.1 DegT/DnrJ/EryC1/StrS family aminotransferase [Planctomycetota bacterium]
MIPMCDLKTQYMSLKSEIDAAMQAVCANTNFILGPEVRKLESEIAAANQCQFAIGVASGTDALHLALRGLNIGPGDEVITTPFTFVATTEAIGMVGATPVFVDIDPDTCNIDVTQIEAAITPRTRVILPVHLYGQACDMDTIMAIAQQHNLHVVEDCAQSIGASYRGHRTGAIGTAGCLSFFPSKNLGGFGDGGMVVTNNEELYQHIEILRRHGGRVKYYHDELGLNSRLDELQAAILLVKHQHLAEWNERRRENAYRYNELLGGRVDLKRPVELTSQGKIIPMASMHTENDLLKAVYHQYTIQVDNRDVVMNHLQKAGIGHAIYYPVPLHLQKVHSELGYRPGSFPHAEQVAANCLSLPMFPELTASQIQTVCSVVLEALDQSAKANTTSRAA